MKLIKYDLDKSLYVPDYLSSANNICFLDIETDGLSHMYNRVILVGLFLIDLNSDTQSIVQVFSEKPEDEPAVLEKLNNLLSGVDTVFTYNGASFDFPFLKKRFEKHRMSHSLDCLNHIDLMKKIRKHKQKLSLPDCKLKTVEKVVGVQRSDTISGKESVLLYREYLKSKSPALEKTILKHNYEDIYYLPEILKIEELLEPQNSISISVAGRHIMLSLDPEKIKFSKSKFKLSISSPSLDIPKYMVFEDNYSLSWNTLSGSLELEFFTESAVDNDSREVKFIDFTDTAFEELLSSPIIPVCIGAEVQYSSIFRLVEYVVKKHI
ncbi:hypothetical protein EUAN_15960 [Andreesenia angusta]|uniref:YprB ribonuclease H-like domain-containing protein n=1 Tax=Andreesenia angusta TaxID=39480 RepID=A0A1S1V6A4_9FIRM|nr:ribonuclease H-like domain-containing protein [Andreesenia angusta]OHW62148.1 hypothetical protein EUAN_15960 [Andreesenia angusta]